MPSRETIDTFVADVLSNDHEGAIGRWYAEDAWTQENQGPRTTGRKALMARERKTMSRMARVETELLAPPLVDGACVAIRWRFTFTTLQGRKLTMEEVAWQVWAGERIAYETYFYDPAQTRD